MNKNKKGFTLVELAIVISVIAILSAVLIPTFSGIVARAKESAKLQMAMSAKDDFISGNTENKIVEDFENYIVEVDDTFYLIKKNGRLERLTYTSLEDIETDEIKYNDENSSNVGDVIIYQPVPKVNIQVTLTNGEVYNSMRELEESGYDILSVENGVLRGESDRDMITELIVSDSVKTIAEYSFSNAENLQRVVLSDSVKQISEYAFCGCESLEEVEISSSVTEIDCAAFADTNITSITIPGNVKVVDCGAFESCDNLTEVILGEGVEYIGRYVFNQCPNLLSITIPSTVTYIEDLLNNEKAFTTLRVAEGNSVYHSVDDKCIIHTATNTLFMAANIEGVFEVPEYVTSIGEQAFGYCDNITEVVLPDNITYIAKDAFWNCCNMAYINIPDTVTYIGQSAFACCSSLLSIHLPENPEYTTVVIQTFLSCASLKDVEIPDNVTSLEFEAFAFCYSLESLEISEYITEIGGNLLRSCDVLPTIDEDNPVYKMTDDGKAIIENGDTLIWVRHDIEEFIIPETITRIGDGAFYGCGNLTYIEIPDSVTYIGDDAFAGTGLTEVVIPNSVITIGTTAFDMCWDLKTIIIPDSVENIGRWLFLNTTMDEVYLEAEAPKDGWEEWWSYSFPVYYYSETYAYDCWHYVNGLPVVW